MIIRKATINDLSALLDIFATARNIQIKNGNLNQWVDGYPSQEIIINDIEHDWCYVVESGAKIVGTFAFIIGEDPTYREIKGTWLNNLEYATIHRIASCNAQRGIFDLVLKWSFERINNIRIDTHSDNSIMMHLLDKTGFKYCGIILTHNGTERVAFQKC